VPAASTPAQRRHQHTPDPHHTAGVVAALRLAQQGFRVTVVDELELDQLGEEGHGEPEPRITLTSRRGAAAPSAGRQQQRQQQQQPAGARRLPFRRLSE
jgi:hypothetical protein